MIRESDIRRAEQILIEKGIKEDEAQTVLQAIGYTLLDAELYPKNPGQKEKEPLTINVLEQIMRDYGVVIRAIPMCTHYVHEACYENQFPNGKVMYLKEYGRNMLIVTGIPKHAGKFLIEPAKHTSVTVRFKERYFDTIEEAINALINGEIELPEYVVERSYL